MEIRHLRLVEAVAEEGSLTKAVHKLNVSASALSHQLKEIESELGVPVFHRLNKKLVLTEAGKVLLGSAQVILNQLEKTEKELLKLRDGNVGSLKLTTECYTCYHWLPGVMSTFSREYPKVDVGIHPEYTREPVKALLNGAVDVVITSTKEKISGVVYLELFRDEQLAVVQQGHPLASKKYLVPEDFADENVIIYNRPLETVSLFTHFLFPANVMPRKVTEMILTEAQIELVKSGYGVKVFARWAVEPYLKDSGLVAIPLSRNGFYRTWYLAHLNRQDLPPYYSLFHKTLVKQLKRLQ